MRDKMWKLVVGAADDLTLALILVMLSLPISPGVGHAQANTAWELGPVLGESEAIFQRVQAIRELPDGRVLVTDPRDNLIHVVRLGAREMRTIGRVGGGPGEFSRASLLFPLEGDTTLFVDGFNGRQLILVRDSIIATITEHQLANRMLLGRVYGVDSLGRLLGGSTARAVAAEAAPTPGSLDVLLWDASRTRADTIGRVVGSQTAPQITGRMSPGGARMFLGTPLSSTDVVALAWDGWLVRAYLSPYHVDWRAPNGVWTRGAPLQSTDIPVTDREKCAALERILPPNSGCDPNEVQGWPKYVPPFVESPSTTATRTLLFDARGHLYVARTPTAEHKGNRYDVIDRKGNRIGVLELPPSQVLVGFGARGAYLSVTDEDGLQRIQLRQTP